MSKTVDKEIPQTLEGLTAYLNEANKEIKRIKPFINEYSRLRIRIKACQERIKKYRIGISNPTPHKGEEG